MKILIAADMEGISGVVHWDQVTPGHFEYPRFRSIMTADVNAAVRGAFESGAKEVVVTDGHHNGRNILIEELDQRANLNSGTPSPLSMVQGVDMGVDGLIFVGYHARVGTQRAILEHTWSGSRVAGVWINDQPFGEIGLNAAVSGHFGVPVIMITGDQRACAEARSLIGSLETVEVKQANGRLAAECLSPQVAQEMIQAAAVKAVNQLKAGNAPEPLHIPAPITLAVELVSSEMADQTGLFPGACRTDRRIEFTAADMPAIYAAFRAMVAMAK